MHRWIARIRCNEYELEESFSVLLFVGEAPDNPAHWRRSPTYIGGYATYNGEYGFDADGEHKVEGFVELNEALLKIPNLRSGSLEPRVVVPYLKNDLTWRVETASQICLSVWDNSHLLRWVVQNGNSLHWR